MDRILHPASERGVTAIDWLDSRHSFSFGDWYEPAWMHFRALRVLNDDRVAAGAGFPAHPHRDMEIVTWVLDGVLEHRDSTGGHGLIRPGELQRMTAGTGIRHSEMNPGAEPVRLLQIWILPRRAGLAPGYGQRAFPDAAMRNRFARLADGDGGDGVVPLQAEAAIHVARLDAGAEAVLAPGRGHAWVQVARGSVRLGELELAEGDGIGISGAEPLRFAARTPAELLAIELA